MWQYPRKKLAQYTDIGMTSKMISRRKVLGTQRLGKRLDI